MENEVKNLALTSYKPGLLLVKSLRLRFFGFASE
jgi:hypothetical protein